MNETSKSALKDINFPEICVECAKDNDNEAKWQDWETCSIGSSDDLLDDQAKEIQELERDFEKQKLGFDLPTNDKTKAGTLDNISVDSYWVGEEEIEDIQNEKQKDPVNPNYKSIYDKIQIKNKQTIQNNGIYNENTQNNQ